MTKKEKEVEVEELLPIGAEVSVGAKNFYLVAHICYAGGQRLYTAVSPDGRAALFTPEKQLKEVTFSPPAENTGVRRVCWHHLTM